MSESQAATQLLRSVAEQLKTPLTTIARQIELWQLAGIIKQADSVAVRTHTTAALTLVDSYLLGLQLIQDQGSLVLEPVSISSVLADTAHELDGMAKQYDTKLELYIGGKYSPIMAHAAGLKAALLALGYALLEGGGSGTLILAAHRTAKGITAGIYGGYEQFSAQAWREALTLKGRVVQPLRTLSGSGAGLFVADAILQAMSTDLRVGRHLKKQGLATTLQLSQQLTFV
jgi:K+-sensing histidine kinase KdpD